MIELLQLWQLQSVNVEAEQSVNSLFIIYVLLSVFVNRPVLLLAYFSTELLFQLSLFDFLSEWNIYTIECIIYSYVWNTLNTKKTKVACILLFCTSLYYVFDAYYFGDSGKYGGDKTFLYESIESIFIFVHLLFIASFISIRGIRCNIRSFINSITSMQNNSYYFLSIC